MRAYEECTRPLTDYYTQKEILVSIRASGTPEEILTRSLWLLKEGFARMGAHSEPA